MEEAIELSKIKITCMICGKGIKLDFRDTRALCKKCRRDPGRATEEPLKIKL
ncbi:MAG: hypothetical protein KAX18_02225 [Candidatus Lokiarchaeota archaeon]|nr:hypothetical protein [Candidatus Lokiarchaeota archaeon]